MSQDQAVAAPSRTSTFRNELNDAVGLNLNGIQFRYNSFPIKQLRRLAHFVLF